jgi:hypothetical protein
VFESNSIVDHHAYLTLCKIGPTPLMIGTEEAEWLNHPQLKHWHRRSKGLIGDLPEKAEGKKRRRLSPAQLQLCPPRVLGFAVSQKKFVQLLVKNVGDGVDKDKEQPFQDLELAKKTKDTLKKLVIEHAKDSIIEDLIPGKGQGLVVLLHGPPGVGKTLTAESLAILTDKPLYSVSMADVGTSPRTVEFNLRRIFQLATHWKALLLFDEADVFLEARSLQDVRRNSLVSTLLRILEYFQGMQQSFTDLRYTDKLRRDPVSHLEPCEDIRRSVSIQDPLCDPVPRAERETAKEDMGDVVQKSE